uniref:GCM domain-containing protein n=1 Tax=Panagrellus redivivus TaxID=6233 RepID=A0A7E4W170_PANRE
MATADHSDRTVYQYEPLNHPGYTPPSQELRPARKRPYESMESSAVSHTLPQAQSNEGWISEGSIVADPYSAMSHAPYGPMDVIDGFLEAHHPGQQLDGDFMDYTAPDGSLFGESSVPPHHNVYDAEMMEAPTSSDVVTDAFALINQAPEHDVFVKAPCKPTAPRPPTFPHGILAPQRFKKDQCFVASFDSAADADRYILEQQVVPGKKPKPVPQGNKRNYVCISKNCRYQVQCFDDGTTYKVYATGVHTCTSTDTHLDNKSGAIDHRKLIGHQISEAGETSTAKPPANNISNNKMPSVDPPKSANNNSTAAASELKWRIVGRFTNSDEMNLAWKAYGVLPTVRKETNDRGVTIKHYKCPSCPYQMMTKEKGKQFALYGLGPHDLTRHDQNEHPKQVRSKAPSPATPFHDQSAPPVGRRSESTFDVCTGTNSTSSPIVDAGEAYFPAAYVAPTQEDDVGVPMAQPLDAPMAQYVKAEPNDGDRIAQPNNDVPMAQPNDNAPVPMQLANNTRPPNTPAASSIPVNHPIENHGAVNPPVPNPIQIRVKDEPLEGEEVEERTLHVTPAPLNNFAVVNAAFREPFKYGPLSLVHVANLKQIACDYCVDLRPDNEETGAFSFHRDDQHLMFKIRRDNSIIINYYDGNEQSQHETWQPSWWAFVAFCIKDRCERFFGRFNV